MAKTELELFETRSLEAVSPLLVVAQELLEKAKAQSIANDDELRAANEIKKEINAHAKMVKDLRLELTRPIDAIKDNILAKEKEILNPLEQAKNSLAESILNYEAEIERKRQEEARRVQAIVTEITNMHDNRTTDIGEVETAGAALKDYFASLPASDQAEVAIKLAFSSTINHLIAQRERLEADARAAAERVRQEEEAKRLEEEAEKQSKEEARIAAKRAEQEAEKRWLEEEAAEIEREKRRIDEAKEQQKLEAEALAAEKVAAKAETARPKSNIVEVYEFEILDPNGVARVYCSPDEKKIRAFIADHKKEIDEGAQLGGISIFKAKKVR